MFRGSTIIAMEPTFHNLGTIATSLAGQAQMHTCLDIKVAVVCSCDLLNGRGGHQSTVTAIRIHATATMLRRSVVLFLGAAFLAGALPEKHYTCESSTTKVSVENVTTFVPFFPTIDSPLLATFLANVFTTRDSNLPTLNFTSLSKTFDIAIEYCWPSTPDADSGTVFFLTHGVGFNRSYWDFHLPSNATDNQYSFVSLATAAGHSTFSWNRLGIPPSTIADPNLEIQATVELDILVRLTKSVRAGTISGLPAPRKLVHVGHSYGSQLTNALAAVEPGLSDGLVFTGYSHVNKYQGLFLASTTLQIANLNMPDRFPSSTYSNDFLTWPNAQSNQFAFFAYPAFDPAVLHYAEGIKQPFTLGEIIGSNLLPLNASNFTGPVYYAASEHDLIFCGFNCTGLFEEGSPAREAFPLANVSVDIIPGRGHALNLHYGAKEVFEQIMDWTEAHVSSSGSDD